MASLKQVRDILPRIRERLLETCKASLADYLEFRKATDRFLADHFSGVCSMSCYQNQRSACCAKDAIITFFADVVINALQSDDTVLDRMETRLQETNTGLKCIYLSPEGCLWHVKPIVCQMFLCDSAQDEIFAGDPARRVEWETLKERKKEFTWPDKPVLFDQMETLFMDAGLVSPLMYCHNSPGLMHVKRKAGLVQGNRI